MHRKIFHLIFALFIFSVPAFGQQANGGHFYFYFKSDTGASVFTMTDEEQKRLNPNINFQDYMKVDKLGKTTYSGLLGNGYSSIGQRTFPIIIPIPTDNSSIFPNYWPKAPVWMLCYRTNSPWVDEGDKDEYCIVSKDVLDSSHTNNGKIIRGTDEIPISDLRPIATLATGMREFDWSLKILQIGGSYVTNDVLEKYAPIGLQVGDEGDRPWLEVAKNLDNGCISFDPRGTAFGYTSDNNFVSRAMADNQKQDDEFLQITNDISQKVIKIAENEKQLAEQKKAEAQQAADEQKHQQELLAGVKTKPSGKPRGGLTVKGFFIGQNISQAVDLYNSKYATNNSATLPIQLAINPLGGFVTTAVLNTNTTNLATLATELNGGSVIFSAGDDGQINQIVISATASDVFFGTTGMSAENFVQKFQAGYNLGTFQSGTDANGNKVWTLESDKGIRVIILNKAMEIDSIASAGDTKFN